MIHGTVIGLQARMGVILRPLRRSPVEIECVIDTGFEGFLTLPSAMVTDLDLVYLAPIRANLADNSQIVTNVHQATIVWNGVEREIPILAMGRRPLIGTSIDFCEDGIVLVDEIL